MYPHFTQAGSLGLVWTKIYIVKAMVFPESLTDVRVGA